MSTQEHLRNTEHRWWLPGLGTLQAGVSFSCFIDSSLLHFRCSQRLAAPRRDPRVPTTLLLSPLASSAIVLWPWVKQEVLIQASSCGLKHPLRGVGYGPQHLRRAHACLAEPLAPNSWNSQYLHPLPYHLSLYPRSQGAPIGRRKQGSVSSPLQWEQTGRGILSRWN